MFHFQDIQVFAILTIPRLTKSVISLQDRVHFGINLLNHNSLSQKLGQLIDLHKDNNFPESFKQFGGLGIGSRSFLI